MDVDTLISIARMLIDDDFHDSFCEYAFREHVFDQIYNLTLETS